MTQAAQRIKDALVQLSVRDRAELARFLIDSLDPGTDDDMEEAWAEELNRRAAELRMGAVEGTPADQVMDELKQKFS